MKKILTALSLIFSLSHPLEAKVTLDSMWGNSMVIQRNERVLFWGQSDNKNVKVSPSWSDKIYTAKVGADGRWQVEIPTCDAGGPYTITYDDGDREQVQLDDVLLGDVWICMGQSNMAMPLRGAVSQPVAGSSELILSADENQPIRMYKMAVTPKCTPADAVDGSWSRNTPFAASIFSAIGYAFGREIQAAIDVPIGLMSVNEGNTVIEAWMSREWLEEFKEYDFSDHENGVITKNFLHAPSFLYNGMVAPLEGLTVKGMLWYQGESNKDNREEYLSLFPNFVSHLRRHFRGGEFPVYYAQIAPYAIKESKPDYVLMRETMSKLMDLTPRTGMVTLTDLGEAEVIHPRFKREAAHRFALWALYDTYKVSPLFPRVAEYDSMEVAKDWITKQNAVVLSFKYAGSGVSFPANQSSKLFEIAGEDRVFYPAEVRVIPKTRQLIVYSKQVPHPVAVRYAFRNYVEGDLYNTYGLPLSSFRTDNWPM
ncbi:MAG: sialate O-acetylesterase [Rikenellaceae bacterium]